MRLGTAMQQIAKRHPVATGLHAAIDPRLGAQHLQVVRQHVARDQPQTQPRRDRALVHQIGDIRDLAVAQQVPLGVAPRFRPQCTPYSDSVLIISPSRSAESTSSCQPLEWQMLVQAQRVDPRGAVGHVAAMVPDKIAHQRARRRVSADPLGLVRLDHRGGQDEIDTGAVDSILQHCAGYRLQLRRGFKRRHRVARTDLPGPRGKGAQAASCPPRAGLISGGGGPMIAPRGGSAVGQDR